MDKFEKDKSILDGKGENDIEWITVKGTHIPIKNGESTKQAVDNFSEKHLKEWNKKGIIILSKQEYAEFCSAIKNKYTNKIPSKGTISLANDFYVFIYNSKQEIILCKLKISIEKNIQKIRKLEAKYGKRDR